MILVISQVMHSQRLNIPPLNVWLVAHKEGEILTAHCNCVAGLGEACSHVGSTLFAVEDAARNLKGTSVTDTKAYWMPPSASLGAPSKVSEVDYSLQSSENMETTEEELEVDSDPEVWEPSESDKKQFLDALFALERKSAVLTMFQPYSDKLDQEATNKMTSRGLLGNLYREENSQLSLNELISLGKTIDCSVDIHEVESMTRKQSKSKSWFLYRAGRITASNFKSVCSTKIEKPSVTLLKRICYPNEMKFKSIYTQYGCAHETKALNDFVANHLQSKHRNLKVWNVGLIIDTNNSFFGASPDRMISCDCCGKGCVEIKCPYCVKDTTIEEIVNLKQSFLKENQALNIVKDPSTHHTLHLDNKHAYYYQVQMQMAVTNTKYCYFVAWTQQNIFYEKIEYNNDFWAENKLKAMLFFEQVVMPELLGKYFTRGTSTEETQSTSENTATQSSSKTNTEQITTDSNTDLWCTCKMPESGRKMVECSNSFCEIKRFHLSCVKLKSVPKRSWYCKKCGSVNFNKKN